VSVPTLGKAIITMRDNGAMYPVYDTMRSSEMKASSGISSIPLVTATGKDEKINVQYNSITIVYPYVVG
jgi:hypothetical protein